jgi:hypothetical protein
MYKKGHFETSESRPPPSKLNIKRMNVSLEVALQWTKIVSQLTKAPGLLINGKN